LVPFQAGSPVFKNGRELASLAPVSSALTRFRHFCFQGFRVSAWVHFFARGAGPADGFPAFDIVIPPSGGGKLIYVCANFGFSADGGITWTASTTPAEARAMAVDPQNPAVIYLSAPNKGLVKSQDGGLTWTVLPSSPVITSGTLTAVLHNPLVVDGMQSSTVYYGTDHGLFISRDSGSTWSQSTTGIASGDTAMRDITGSKASSGTVYLLAGSPDAASVDLYQSTDHGASWSPLASTLDAERIVPDPVNPSVIYLSGLVSHAIYKSTDGGHIFVPSDSGMPQGGPSLIISGPTGTLIPLTAVPNTFLSTIGNAGVFRSQDAAASWSLSTSGISAWFGLDVAFDPSKPSTVYLATSNCGGIWKSTDTGATWTNLRRNSANAIAVDPFDSAHLLAAASGEGLIESHDGGSTWQTVTNLPPRPVALLSSQPSLFILFKTARYSFRRNLGKLES
jgi:photosystem II stability/assembly factor-like uncharacterized protein